MNNNPLKSVISWSKAMIVASVPVFFLGMFLSSLLSPAVSSFICGFGFAMMVCGGLILRIFYD